MFWSSVSPKRCRASGLRRTLPSTPLRERFLGLTLQALAGELASWSAVHTGGLALVLLLDQFPRQIWRDTAMAFAGDPQALALSLGAVEGASWRPNQSRPGGSSG
jgi:uncharacterized protein (DUF924 family)